MNKEKQEACEKWDGIYTIYFIVVRHFQGTTTARQTYIGRGINDNIKLNDLGLHLD